MNLVLYYYPSCPFCRRVLSFMEEQNIDIQKKNINESEEMRDELVEIGGKSQVPCLVVDGKALYESMDIINWLTREYSKK